MALPIYNTSPTQAPQLGSEYLIGTDRVFRYCKNGPAALAVGTVLQGPRPNDSHSNLACAATAADISAVTLTLDRGDPVLINEYKEGYLYTNDADGAGYLYEVLSHPGAEGEDTTVKITIRDHTVVALTTSSQATLIPNAYSGVNKPGGDPWDVLVGVTPVAVPSNEYFWCQVRGPAVVLQAGALFAGRGVMASQDKPGAVSVIKQVVPVIADARSQRVSGGTDSGPAVAPTATGKYSQKALEQRDLTTGKFDDAELLEDFSGRATIPERVIGYCINPRVSTEHALIYLTLS